MEWQRLLDVEILSFIRRNSEADVRQLALKKPLHSDWPYPLILDQIKVRQKAKIKSPELYDTDGFIFPMSDLFEQASSQACASYKATLVRGESFVDLTAGAGIDAFSFAGNFCSCTLIERNSLDFQILRHNSEALGLADRVQVIHGDALDYVRGMHSVDCVYIDPQRREAGRKGIYDLSACSPDIIKLLPILKGKAKTIILKTSPVLDIQKAIETLGFVKEVHVVGWSGDCKEVLYVLDMEVQTEFSAVRVIAVDLDDVGAPKNRFTFSIAEEAEAQVKFSSPEQFLYEPSPAFMKAAGFKSMAVFYKINKLHPSTHLYTSTGVQENFCGKIYKILDIVAPKEDQMPIKKAELVLRNFPGDVATIRKKLKLSEGDHYRVFGVKLFDGSKKMIICEKL